MQSNDRQHPESRTAEDEFRDAFYRLKSGAPIVLPAGASVTQNNVAKEAGKDPSALRKSRYPKLILEIQDWISSNAVALDSSRPRNDKKISTDERQRLINKIAALRRDRDVAQSLLVQAHAKILQLRQELARFQQDEQQKSNVVFL